MPLYDTATLTALEAGQLVLRDFLTVFGWNSVGAATTYAFWTGEDDITTSVVSPTDGTIVSRNFIGGGALPQAGVPAIVDSIGIEARSVEFGLNQLHASVEDMVRSGNIRLAVLELHRGLFDPATWSLVSFPYARFLGRVDGVTVDTPEAGGEGRIRIAAIADTIELTRTNPALKSDETQKLRSGDRFRRYADSAGSVEIWWGLAKSSGDA